MAMRRHRHELPFGAAPVAGGVRFRLWAPRARAVSLQLETPRPDMVPMVCEGEGWWALTTELAEPGACYRYVVDGIAFPDPASRWQPEGVHGPSQVVDPDAYEWRDLAWRGRPWEEIVLYELHLGTFSEAGDFAGAARHLDHLCRLGVTAVELMPIAEFPGARNWGYDGVFPLRPLVALRPAGGAEAARRGLPRPRPCDPARCRLQSLRTRGELPADNRARFLYRAPPHAMGGGGRLLRAEEPAGARFFHPQRALLARRVPVRRAAPRCRPCHCR